MFQISSVDFKNLYSQNTSFKNSTPYNSKTMQNDTFVKQNNNVSFTGNKFIEKGREFFKKQAEMRELRSYLASLKDEDNQRRFLSDEINQFLEFDFDLVRELTTTSYFEPEFKLTEPLDHWDILQLLMAFKKHPSNMRALLDESLDSEQGKILKYTPRELVAFAEIYDNNPDLVEYMKSDEYSEKLKEATKGNYQNRLIKMLSYDTMPYYVKAILFSSNLTGDELIESINKFTKSTYKKAMNKPHRYLSNISVEYTTEVDGKLPKLDEKIDTRFKERMNHCFELTAGKILRALKYVDTDTINQLMDKRTAAFSNAMSLLNDLTDENYELLSKLIKCKNMLGKDLTAKNKIELTKLVIAHQFGNIDTEYLNAYIENGMIDIQALKDKLKGEIIEIAGIDKEAQNGLPKQQTQFNDEHFYSAFMQVDNEVLLDVINATVNGNFEQYISDVNNKYGEANEQTKMLFAKHNLSFNNWLNPEIKSHSFEVQGDKMTIKLWDRNPKEDLFLGSKTTCCTALDRGNGRSTPAYLANKAFNVVELKTSDGKTVGMSRVFMGMDSNKPVLIMDNIELANGLKKEYDDEELKTIRNAYFEYMNEYVKAVSDNPNAKVYFAASYSKVPVNDLKPVEKKIDFLGRVSEPEIYINTFANSNVNVKEFKKYPADLFEVPANA